VPKPADRSVTILLIGIFKLLKALCLVLIAVTAFHLVNKDLGQTIERWAIELHLDPGGKLVRRAISHALNISPKKLELVGVVTLIYAGLFGTEGVGLLLGKRWAEYMTIITTGLLMPLEIYEILKHANFWKIATLVINAAAVVYLIVRIWKAPKQESPSNPIPQSQPATDGV
jgi:uncharacterized membrane protein (DUF2068 family)